MHGCCMASFVVDNIAPKIPVSVNKNTPSEKKAAWKMSLQSTKWWAGELFLPLDCMTKAHVKELFFHRHRYVSLED